MFLCFLRAGTSTKIEAIYCHKAAISMLTIITFMFYMLEEGLNSVKSVEIFPEFDVQRDFSGAVIVLLYSDT